MSHTNLKLWSQDNQAYDESDIRLSTELKQIGEELLNQTLSPVVMPMLLSYLTSIKSADGDVLTLRESATEQFRQFYETEHAIGVKALHVINERYKLSLPIEEVSMIALIFIKAQTENLEVRHHLLMLVSEVEHCIESFFERQLNRSSVYYNYFVSHMNGLVRRLSTDSLYQDEIDLLYESAKIKYRQSFECAILLKELIVQKYQFTLTNEEVLCLVVHIQRMMGQRHDKLK